MAVREGSISAEHYTNSLIDRFRDAPEETFRFRLLLWSATMALASYVLTAVLPVHGRVVGASALTAFFSVSGCASLAASVYCFAIFILGRRIRCVLVSAAFATLAGGSILQAVLDFSLSQPVAHGLILSSAWAVAAFLFAGSALVGSSWRPVARFGAVVQAAASMLFVTAFPVAGGMILSHSDVLWVLSGSTQHLPQLQLGEDIAAAVAALFIVVAIIGHSRRFAGTRDRMAGLICYFIIPCAFGLALRAQSGVRFDSSWVTGQILLSVGWLTLVAGVALEGAFSQHEAEEQRATADAVHDVSWSLVGAEDLTDLLYRFVKTIGDRLGTDMACIYLADEEHENLRLTAAAGPKECASVIGSTHALVAKGRWPGFHSGHTARAFGEQTTQVARDVFIDVEFVSWRVIAVDEGCAVSVPLINKGCSVGVINLYYSNYRDLTRQRLKLFDTLSVAAAPAIDSAYGPERKRLFEQAEVKRNEAA